jgi:hypothetical protein
MYFLGSRPHAEKRKPEQPRKSLRATHQRHPRQLPRARHNCDYRPCAFPRHRVREGRVRVYKEAPGFRPGPGRKSWLLPCPCLFTPHRVPLPLPPPRTMAQESPQTAKSSNVSVTITGERARALGEPRSTTRSPSFSLSLRGRDPPAPAAATQRPVQTATRALVTMTRRRI